MKKGILLVPTLNRIELLKRFIQSYKDTGSEVKTLLLVDEKDYEVNAAGYKEVLDLIQGTPLEIVNTHESVTMGDKIRFIYPKLDSIVPNWEWVGLLNDDHVIKTFDWDKIASELLDGKNFISTNDGFWMSGLKCCGLTAWSRGLLEKAGIPIYPPNLQHLYIDDLWKAVGESSGSWLETMRINVEHRHHLRGMMSVDATAEASQTQDKYIREERVFREFMEGNFKDICLNIVKFREPENLDQKFV